MNMFNAKMLLSLLIFTSIVSCKKKYIRTDKIYGNNLFVEIYEKYSQIGVSYLTDSSSFKIYIGQINFENEYYKYEYKDDNLIIRKFSKDFFKGVSSVIETKKFNINELKKR